MSANANQSTDQLALGPPEQAEHADRVKRKLSFATDEQLAVWLRPTEDRLTQVENGIAHFTAMLPGMQRECAAIRQNIAAVLHELDREAA